MLISLLILWPLLGIFIIYSLSSSYETNDLLNANLKKTALFFSLVEILISLIIWFLFDNTSKHFQFVQEQYTVGHYDIYLGLDGLSIYFVLLTTFIISISIISNWKSINENSIYFLVIMLLLESALLLVYSVLDILMFYVFFESILAPLFVLIGLFGSKDKHRAGFYLFLYTLLGSLFMLLSIITISSLAGSTDMDIINYTNYTYITQVFLFIGIFIAFAVKTPVIFLNSWLLKAHVESPLSGSVILAAIVLKLSLYGVFRLILPLVPKAFMYYTYIVFFICVITILYASFSTIRTIDVKELIAYSSVSHAVVYLGAVFSNVIQGIQGGILLGLAHGFVSSGLFICAGGILYDRSHTRTIYYYRGLAQIMPIFSILFFILCLGNCGTPLTLNFVGEFMSLYGIFERIPLAGMLASSSIVFSAAYTILLFNKTTLGGSFTSWNAYLTDVKLRECSILTLLVVFTVLAGIYPSIILDSLHYVTTNLLFTGVTYNDAIEPWSFFLQDDCTFKSEDINYPIMIFLIMLPSIFFLSATTIGDYLETINDHISMHYLTIEPYIGPIYGTLNVTFRLLLNTDLECSELYLCPFSDTELESDTQLEPEWEGYCTMNWVDHKSEEEMARMRDIRHEQQWIANRRGRIPTETIEVRSTLGLTNGKNSIHAMNDPTGTKIESITGIKPTIPSCNPNFGRGVLIESNSIVRESAKLVTMEPHNTFNPNWLNENTHPNKQITSNGKPLTCNISISPFGELIREWRDWAGTRSLSRVFGYSWNVFTMEENFRYAFDDEEKMREEMGGKRKLDSNTQPESQMGKKRKLDSDTQPESQMSRKRIK